MISPVVFFALVIGVIQGFQYFTQAYVASAAVAGNAAGAAASNVGSPQGSLMFYSLYLYVQGFANFRMGYASAMAWMLFAIVMAFTLILIKSSNRWVFYQGGFR
jgi:multiple sugar transport system permease protein